MQASKEEEILLFIAPLDHAMTILGYTNGKIQVLDISINRYFKRNNGIKEKGYKSPIFINHSHLYPMKAIRSPDCCWLHIETLYGSHIKKYMQLLHTYDIDVSISQIAQIHMQIICDQIE